MKKLICILAALLVSSAAYADYLQLADEAGDTFAAAELREYVYASGAARDAVGETKRLFIVNYDLNREKQKSDYAQSFCTDTYEKAGKPEELDFLSKEAYEYSKNSSRLQAKISQNEAYLAKLNSDKKTLARADELASLLEKKADRPQSKKVRPTFIVIALMLAAASVAVIKLPRKLMGVGGMAFRDARRFIYKGRYALLAVALGCAAAMGIWQIGYEKCERAWDVPQVPAADGEYIAMVEELRAYCDVLAVREPELASQAENIKRYQLTSAMAEILNGQVAKDMGGVLERYRALGEKYRLESENAQNRAWQAYNNAVNGPKADFADTMREYVRLGIEAGSSLADAEYCENIVRLMSMENAVDPKAEERTEAFISEAVVSLEEITAPIMAEPPLDLESAVLVGYFCALALGVGLVLLLGALELALRRNKQRKFVKGAQNGFAVEKVNFRG